MDNAEYRVTVILARIYGLRNEYPVNMWTIIIALCKQNILYFVYLDELLLS